MEGVGNRRVLALGLGAVAARQVTIVKPVLENPFRFGFAVRAPDPKDELLGSITKAAQRFPDAAAHRRLSGAARRMLDTVLPIKMLEALKY